MSTLIIFGILILCIFIPGWIEALRFGDYRWVWKYGNLISKGTVYLMFLWSFLLPIMIWTKDKKKFKAKIFWITFEFIPFFYFLTLMVLSK